MRKPHVHETVREEAERHEALEQRGKLDVFPFTRLRRYAKESSQVYAIRIPVSRLRAIRWLADRRKERPTALLREWVLERLDEELAETEPTRVKEDRPPYLTARAPGKKSASSVARASAGGAAKTSTRKAAPAKKR
ncbi:MAG: hypothetical protein HY775_12615 [Acidobacteria bacterium]|nr:hypothetical protein [Acidobacteriota bacterium]